MSGTRGVRAFAPATVSNVAVGFDLLGYPIPGVGDIVEVWPLDGQRMEVELLPGSVCDVPSRPDENTAAVALQAMRKALSVDHGYRIRIKKGISMGSGMGGSAASAVGAVVAANALLDHPVPLHELIPFALAGEAVASGGRHADNVVPCLLGGMRLCLGEAGPLGSWPEVPVPGEIRSVVVHPDVVVKTKEARGILKPQVALKDHVRQSGNLGGFLSACHSGDLVLLSRCMADLIVEPQRAALIPGFAAVKAAALDEGALGCSISGSGPSVFAWADSESTALRVQAAMRAAFEEAGRKVECWAGPVPREGARILP